MASNDVPSYEYEQDDEQTGGDAGRTVDTEGIKVQDITSDEDEDCMPVLQDANEFFH